MTPTVISTTTLAHNTLPRDHLEHCSGRVQLARADPISLLRDTGADAPERSDPLPTHPETTPKHALLAVRDLLSVRQLPVSWLSEQQAAECRERMVTRRSRRPLSLLSLPWTPSTIATEERLTTRSH